MISVLLMWDCMNIILLIFNLTSMSTANEWREWAHWDPRVRLLKEDYQYYMVISALISFWTWIFRSLLFFSEKSSRNNDIWWGLSIVLIKWVRKLKKLVRWIRRTGYWPLMGSIICGKATDSILRTHRTKILLAHKPCFHVTMASLYCALASNL